MISTALSDDFLAALWRSPTFVAALSGYGLALMVAVVAGLAGLGFLRARRRRRPRGLGCLARDGRLAGNGRHLAGDERGVVLAAELVLVVMPVILFVLLVAQICWMMRETVILHYAAFAAARSARVHLCPPIPDPRAVLRSPMGRAGCTGDRRRAETAARMALVAASPPWGIPCQSSCVIPREALVAIARETGVSAQSPAILDQARYAFDRANVSVSVDFEPKGLILARQAGEVPPVKARVTFRHYVIYGIGQVFGTRRSDGYFYRASTAEMTLL